MAMMRQFINVTRVRYAYRIEGPESLARARVEGRGGYIARYMASCLGQHIWRTGVDQVAQERARKVRDLYIRV